MYMYSFDDLTTTIETLRELQEDIAAGEFYGWGLEEERVAIVKSWLENIRLGNYGNRMIQPTVSGIAKPYPD